MTDPSPPLAAPAWVYKRDGRLVPFDADKISQALFAATEGLGRPDAFLVRELTDGVVHFLAAEADGTIPRTAQVADLIVKVVRELGQPALARAFQEGQRAKDERRDQVRRAETAVPQEHASPPLKEQLPLWVEAGQRAAALEGRAGRASLREFTLHNVFTRDLIAAHRDGPLTLTGLEAPFEVAGCVLGPREPGGQGLVEGIEAARYLAGGYLAIDGPEHALVREQGAGDAAMTNLVRELGIGLRATGLRAVVNLNCPSPPTWADDLAEGPLFAGRRERTEPEHLQAVTHLLREQLVRSGCRSGVRIDWHLGEGDFVPANERRLLDLARCALEGDPLAFVFDRPRRQVVLGEGLDRRHPVVLLTVGLHLPWLACETPGADPTVFLQKLGSLARLALSAAVQKRDFLRRHGKNQPAFTRGFLLERARLVVAPVGLEAAVRTMLGRGLCADAAALDLGKQIVQRLRDVLSQDGRAVLLETCLDTPDGFAILGDGKLRPEETAGLTVWDAGAPAKSQLRAAGSLHAVAEAGTAAVLFADGELPSPDRLVEWLQAAWRRTDVVRLRFVRPVAPGRQLTLGLQAGNEGLRSERPTP